MAIGVFSALYNYYYHLIILDYFIFSEVLCPGAVAPCSPFLSPWQPLIYLISLDFPISNVLNYWPHTMSDLFCQLLLTLYFHGSFILKQIFVVCLKKKKKKKEEKEKRKKKKQRESISNKGKAKGPHPGQFFSLRVHITIHAHTHIPFYLTHSAQDLIFLISSFMLKSGAVGSIATVYFLKDLVIFSRVDEISSPSH